MKSTKPLVMILAALAAGLVIVATPWRALAYDCSSRQSGDWNLAATWTNCGNAIPNDDDTATINVGHTVNAIYGGSGYVEAINLTINGTLQPAEVSGAATSRNLVLTGNFINNGVFRAGNTDDTLNVRLIGSSLQTIGGSSTTAFYGLELANSGAAGVSLGANVIIEGWVSLYQNSGGLRVQDHDLTLGPSATYTPSTSQNIITDEDGTQTGRMCKQFKDGSDNPDLFVFPIGDKRGAAEYSPVSLDFGWTTFSGSNFTVCARVTDNMHPNMPAQAPSWLTRYWTLTSPNGSATTRPYARFNYLQSDVTGSEDKLRYYFWNSSSWATASSVSVDVANNYFSLGLPGYSTDHTVFEPSPAAVRLVSLQAVAEPGVNRVVVTWDTAAETDTQGFNLLRSALPLVPEIRLNERLIPSQGSGSPEGFHYTFVDDAGLVPGATYWYTLEDVSTAGVATRHEPVSVVYSAGPTAVALAGFAASRATAPAALAALAALACLTLALRRRTASDRTP